MRRQARGRAFPRLVVLIPILVLLPKLALTSANDVGRAAPLPITVEPRVPNEPTARNDPTATETPESAPLRLA